MWLYLQDSFLSIVQDKDHPEHLHVRGRFAGDIERVFGPVMGKALKVRQVKPADYKFRATVPRALVAQVVASRLMDIHYEGFKEGIAGVDPARHSTYMRVWSIMCDAQARHEESPALDRLELDKPKEAAPKKAPAKKKGGV